MGAVTEETHNDSAGVPYALDIEEGETIRWFGNAITVKASGPQFDVAFLTVVAGSEPPRHVHETADEAYLVLDGTIVVVAGQERLAAEAGGFVFLPHGVPHTFEVKSGTARLVALSAPSGMLLMHQEIDGQLGASMPPTSRPSDYFPLNRTLAQYGVRLIREGGLSPRSGQG